MKKESWWNRNKDWFHIIADFVTIASLISAIVIFLWQLNQQQQAQINQVVGELNSTNLEIAQNLDLMSQVKNTNLVNKTFHFQFAVDNLRIVATDNRILNPAIKKEAIARLIDLTEYNNRILYINSPQFSPLVLKDADALQTIQLYQKETINTILQEGQRLLNTRAILNSYANCLEQNISFEHC